MANAPPIPTTKPPAISVMPSFDDQAKDAPGVAAERQRVCRSLACAATPDRRARRRCRWPRGREPRPQRRSPPPSACADRPPTHSSDRPSFERCKAAAPDRSREVVAELPERPTADHPPSGRPASTRASACLTNREIVGADAISRSSPARPSWFHRRRRRR